MRLRWTILATLIFATAARMNAQTDLDSSILAGRIFPAEKVSQPASAAPGEEATTISIFGESTKPRLPAAGTKPKPLFLVQPLFLDNDSGTVRSFTAGIIYGTVQPLRATLSYSHVDPDGSSSHFDSYGAAVKWKGWSKKDVYALTALASYSDTRSASTKAQFGLVDEFHLVKSLTGGIDLRWVTKSGTTRVHDLVPAATLAYSFPKIIVGASYAFKNDVDKQNDYGGELQIPSPAGVFVVGGGKHHTFRVAFAKVFGLK